MSTLIFPVNPQTQSVCWVSLTQTPLLREQANNGKLKQYPQTSLSQMNISSMEDPHTSNFYMSARVFNTYIRSVCFRAFVVLVHNSQRILLLWKCCHLSSLTRDKTNAPVELCTRYVAHTLWKQGKQKRKMTTLHLLYWPECHLLILYICESFVLTSWNAGGKVPWGCTQVPESHWCEPLFSLNWTCWPLWHCDTTPI